MGEGMDVTIGSFGPADGVRPRDAERFAVAVSVRLKPEGSRVITVTSGDLSTTGLMAHVDRPVPLGCQVSVELPGIGDVPAKVRWTVGGRVGMRFGMPIDAEACRSAMVRLAGA